MGQGGFPRPALRFTYRGVLNPPPCRAPPLQRGRPTGERAWRGVAYPMLVYTMLVYTMLAGFAMCGFVGHDLCLRRSRPTVKMVSPLRAKPA